MVKPLNNKKIAALVIENSEAESGYEQINPESLATVIYENKNIEDAVEPSTDPTVQSHIDDTSIHFTENSIESKFDSKYLQIDNVIQGEGIQIEQPNPRAIKISSSVNDLSEYMKRESLVKQDETITLTPFNDESAPEQDRKKLYIRANIPDVSNFLVSANIMAKDNTIDIERDRYSNNVYIKSNPMNYEVGEGLQLIDGVISNSAPDKVVGLIEGDNIKIDGNYPDFTITARNKLNVEEWVKDFEYKKGDVIIHNGGLYYCNVELSQKSAFDPLDWQIVADYKMTRKMFVTGNEPTQIINLNHYGIIKPIQDSDTLIINVGGIIPLSDTYRLREDGYTLEFTDGAIPPHTPIEVMILSNSILNSLDPTANINDWEPETLYSVGNIVIYENALYKCVDRHTSDDEFDVSHWQILMNYTKDVYEFNFNEDVSQIVLPVTIIDKNNLMINVGNTLLLNSSFDLEDDNHTITFNHPIEAGVNIEVTVYTHGILRIPEIPTPNAKDLLLISNNSGTAYVTITKEELLQKLGLYKLTQLNGNNNNLIGVNEEGTDFAYYTDSELSSKVKLRNTTNGFDVLNKEQVKNKTTDNLITFAEGSTLSEDNSLMMSTYSNNSEYKNIITKNFAAKWEYGNNKGSLLSDVIYDVVWNQPVITSSDIEKQLRVTTYYSETSDREGWRAMDEFTETGNGWFGNHISDSWQYVNPIPIKIDRFTFRKPNSQNTKNLSLDLWVSDDSALTDNSQKEKIYVARNVVISENEAQITVNIENPLYARAFGFDIKNLDGNAAVGAIHVLMEGYNGQEMPSDGTGYIYVISNESGSFVDIATSYNKLEELEPEDLRNILPAGFIKYKQIGIFRTDENGDIWDVYPMEDINKFYINRNFVNQDQLEEIIDNYDEIIEEKIDNIIESKGVYTKDEVNNLLLEEETRAISEENNKVSKTSESNKIYGTDENGEQILLDRTLISGVRDVKAGNDSVVVNSIAVLGDMAKQSSSNYYNKSQSNSKYAGKSYEEIVTSNQNDILALQNAISDLQNVIETYKNSWETVYPVDSIYITTSKSSVCPLASIVKKPNGGNSEWSLVAQDRVLQGASSVNNSGQIIEAGLPDHDHQYATRCFSFPSDWDANVELGIHYSNSIGWKGDNDLPNRLRKTSGVTDTSIYGNSDTVQPPAYTVNIWKRTA